MTKVIGNEYASGGDGVEVKGNSSRELGRTTLRAVTAAPLRKGFQTYHALTCVTVSVDQAAGGTVPAWAQYVFVFADAAFKVAFDEATSSTVGIPVDADSPALFPIQRTTGGDSTIHAQVPTTAGTVVYVGYLAD